MLKSSSADDYSKFFRELKTMTQVVIHPRFTGLPGIALGGYVGGILARQRPIAEVVFRRPVHIGKSYQWVEGTDATDQLKEGDNVLAEARGASLDIELPRAVTLDESKIATQDYPGNRKHLFPNCFVCGPLRTEGDGLRIFPGIVEGRQVVAAPWTPPSSLSDERGAVKSEFVWSALDCPTIWPLILWSNPDSEDLVVSSRLTVNLISPLIAGQTHIVMGWKIEESGRARVGGGAIFSSEGCLLATARHTLVTTNWGVPVGLNHWL